MASVTIAVIGLHLTIGKDQITGTVRIIALFHALNRIQLPGAHPASGHHQNTLIGNRIDDLFRFGAAHLREQQLDAHQNERNAEQRKHNSENTRARCQRLKRHQLPEAGKTQEKHREQLARAPGPVQLFGASEPEQPLAGSQLAGQQRLRIACRRTGAGWFLFRLLPHRG